jgi:Ca2+/Na+ antiporter
MDSIIALVFFSVGLGLIMFFAEQLVKGVVGTSVGFGLSTFLLSVVFIGFDPDNLAVGTVASAEGAAGMALGSILGGAMVAVAFAFGFSALVTPMTFAQVPPQVIAVQLLAVVLFGGHCQLNATICRKESQSGMLRPFCGHFVISNGRVEHNKPPKYPLSGRDFVAHPLS